jgi:hypothetical protein
VRACNRWRDVRTLQDNGGRRGEPKIASRTFFSTIRTESTVTV